MVRRLAAVFAGWISISSYDVFGDADLLDAPHYKVYNAPPMVPLSLSNNVLSVSCRVLVIYRYCSRLFSRCPCPGTFEVRSILMVFSMLTLFIVRVFKLTRERFKDVAYEK